MVRIQGKNQNRKQVVSDLRPVAGNTARTSFPWGVGGKNGGRNRRYREGDASRRRAHVEFSDQKKRKNTKSVSQSDSSKVARVRGVGFFFRGGRGCAANSGDSGVFLSRSELTFLSRLSPLNFFLFCTEIISAE